MKVEQITNEDWEYEINRAKEMLEVYKSIPTGLFGATIISQSIERYENGERTEDLYENLKNIN